MCITMILQASVAQLDRASVFGTEGCRFDSCRCADVSKTESKSWDPRLAEGGA